VLVETPRDVLPEQRPQILVDVAVPAAVVGRALVVRRIVERLKRLQPPARAARARGS
jgi:hypothetical protein